MASAAGPRNNFNPSIPDSDTPYASSEPSKPTSYSYQQGYPIHSTKPSLSIIRPRGLSTTSSASSVKRKPLPSTASPLATRSSSGGLSSTSFESRYSRRFSIDSPTLYEDSASFPVPSIPEAHLDSQRDNRAAEEQRELTPVFLESLPQEQEHTTSKGLPFLPKPVPSDNPNASSNISRHASVPSESAVSNASISTVPSVEDTISNGISSSATMSIFSTKATPPHLTLPNNVHSRNLSYESTPNNNSKQPPKSPGASKLGNFFGWGATSPASNASFSEKAYSPAPSPTSPELVMQKASTLSRTRPAGIDVPRANGREDSYFDNEYFKELPAAPQVSEQVEEMEEELKTITGELATSIRREMELEDLVERLQAEAANPQGPNRRTSDYFSDSGTSSVKYGGETDARAEELERLQRKTDREKAQIRLELTGKVQEERSHRKVLEARIRNLEDMASSADLVSINSLNDGGRLKELELTCEDLRRRLSEERQVKENFEDLLTALKSDLHNSHNERDNLRDEIVPQLRARVEGLEAQAAEHEKLTYENTKMQQQMQTLKNENVTLVNARKLQTEMQLQANRFNSISEEPEQTISRAGPRLSRSNSLKQPPVIRASRPPSLTRSSSVKVGESRDALAERVKDVEAQRDALHSALKSLLERQEYQNRENQKKIRQLEMEKERALADFPRRLGYDREVANLREEINSLRRRAEEAIEQKWQCEKGLSGLKMDLDRAEQEIGSLRSLLRENDILIPANRRLSRSNSATSESLERAYKDLQKAYVESLDRVKVLEESSPRDEDTERAMLQLERSLSMAISERDFARQQAEAYRDSVESLQASEQDNILSETALADELRSSAQRVEELATQVRQQLTANSALRQRLADAIERGDRDQKANTARITYMQAKLRTLEESLMVAQQTSEEHVMKHEDEVRGLRESHHSQLLRVKDGLKSPRLFSPKSPLSPLFANGSRSPRLDSTTSGKGMSITEQSKAEFLKIRVMELEKALEEADKEMEEVVGRMNIAQIEVMELQNEREEAVRQTRKLQARIEAEKIASFETKFATLSS